ncbi:transcriptional regulator [Enterococcus faecium]|nr:transcriptional regulator [Enterococcus faecium]
MYDGELIKKLRVNKKLTQTQLAEGICSITSLVGIETNSVKKVSFGTLKSFLERMNMTLAEYEWIRNQLDEPKKLKKKRRMLDRIQEDSFDPYKEIANNRRHYKKTEDLYYLVLNLHMSKKTEVSETEFEFLRYECRIIEEYLMQVPEYGQFEVSILADFPWIFSDRFIENNYLKIKKRMRRIAQLNNHEQYLFTFLTNLTLFYIENGRLKKARSVNEDMKRSLAHKERSTVIYETLMADYYQRLISAALGEEKSENHQEFFAVIEYTLGKNQRNSLEKKLLAIAKPSS